MNLASCRPFEQTITSFLETSISKVAVHVSQHPAEGAPCPQEPRQHSAPALGTMLAALAQYRRRCETSIPMPFRRRGGDCTAIRSVRDALARRGASGLNVRQYGGGASVTSLRAFWEPFLRAPTSLKENCSPCTAAVWAFPSHNSGVLHCRDGVS